MSHENLLFSTVAVTGALGGIGKVVTRELNELGAHVIAIDLVNESDAATTLKEIAPNNARYIKADLTQENSLEELDREFAKDKYPDAIIFLAGVVVSGDLVNQHNDNIEKVVNVNLVSQMKLARNISQAWIQNNIKGHMIFVSSWIDHVPWPGVTPYAASKAGLHALARGIARENAKYGIRSNVISPGIVDVGMAAQQWRTEPDYKKRASRAIPLGRLQKPEEVADGIIFLLSDRAQYMTGSNLLIDGGASLYPMDPEELV